MADKCISLAGFLICALLSTSCHPNAHLPVVSGTIETDEVRLASRAGGRVERVLAREGDGLTNGQPVVQLSAPELSAQHDQAAALLAELEAGPRPQELTAARSDWEALTAELELARAEAGRATALFASQTISATERDRAFSRVQTLEKNAAAARSRFDLLQAGTRPERITQARARLSELDIHLRELRIDAPAAGILEVLNVKVGDVSPPNREVATLILTNRLWVRVYVPESWLGYLRLNQTSTVRVDSFPGRDFPGTVEQINRAAEFTPRNTQTVAERIKQVIGVKVRLEPGDGQLRAGMAADVLFPGIPPELR